ncbi:unnamed protein product, partial [marine sediment metagenome]
QKLPKKVTQQKLPKKVIGVTNKGNQLLPLKVPTIDITTIDTITIDNVHDLFETIWPKYPIKGRVHKKLAKKHFVSTVKTIGDWKDIQDSLEYYKKGSKVKKGYIQNASTWFNDWHNWRDIYKEIEEKERQQEKARKNIEAKEKAERELDEKTEMTEEQKEQVKKDLENIKRKGKKK